MWCSPYGHIYISSYLPLQQGVILLRKGTYDMINAHFKKIIYYFFKSPPFDFFLTVTPTLIVTSPSAMQRFSPAERDCYSEDEISLKYLPRDHGFRYEMSNCLFESAFEHILRVCKCFPGKIRLKIRKHCVIASELG